MTLSFPFLTSLYKLHAHKRKTPESAFRCRQAGASLPEFGTGGMAARWHYLPSCLRLPMPILAPS